MIFVLFPPGCYSFYLTRCLYNYTDLSPVNNELFEFGEHGHSHAIRNNVDLAAKMPSPCQPIFDEAYVQHLLRQKGFEIKCNSLNTFPNSATQLRSLIYRP